jgi:hypothetical protein
MRGLVRGDGPVGSLGLPRSQLGGFPVERFPATNPLLW